jgi:phosphate transport system protein
MTHFDIELEKLRKRIIDMSSLVEQQLSDTITALLKGDTELANQIIEADKKVDLIDVKIDKLCQRIFALAQPVASDLRFIMSSLKINTDVERVGDLAVSIAKRIEGVSENIDFLEQLNIDDIALKARNIFSDAVNSFVFKDTELAYKIIENAKEIDELSDQISNDIVNAMLQKSEVIVAATNLILILRHLKRLSDHSTNIAESVVFMVEGKIIKHTK